MFSPSEARKLAEAIYDHNDYYGISEIDAVVDVLTGEASAEEFIAEIEGVLQDARKKRQGNGST